MDQLSKFLQLLFTQQDAVRGSIRAISGLRARPPQDLFQMQKASLKIVDLAQQDSEILS